MSSMYPEGAIYLFMIKNADIFGGKGTRKCIGYDVDTSNKTYNGSYEEIKEAIRREIADVLNHTLYDIILMGIVGNDVNAIISYYGDIEYVKDLNELNNLR